MKKLTVSDIRSIKPGTSMTFHLDDSRALSNAAATAWQTQKRFRDEDKITYSCSKDTENNKITIEAKSID